MTDTPVPPAGPRPDVFAFFDAATNTISYVVEDPGSDSCAVIDPVMDLDYAAGRISYAGADAIVAHLRARGRRLEWIVETHVHADHLSAALYIKQRCGGRIAIGDRIGVVQDVFGRIFAEGPDFRRDGSQFDRLFAEGDTYRIGGLRAVALHTPGHTPACMTHLIGDAAFVGDTLFMPDGGSARADFPHPRSAASDASFHVPRLRPQRQADTLGEQRRRGTARQYPCARRHLRGRIRGHARGARPHACHAAAHPAVVAGEHEGRRPAARRSPGAPLPEASHQRLVTRHPRMWSARVDAAIVTIMRVPQSLAYALLSGLPRQVGLHASILPLFAYSAPSAGRSRGRHLPHALRA
jgi:glyoxylase-like metal-dependent hydrolase (beta-lactamase superfamily II)